MKSEKNSCLNNEWLWEVLFLTFPKDARVIMTWWRVDWTSAKVWGGNRFLSFGTKTKKITYNACHDYYTVCMFGQVLPRIDVGAKCSPKDRLSASFDLVRTFSWSQPKKTLLYYKNLIYFKIFTVPIIISMKGPQNNNKTKVCVCVCSACDEDMWRQLSLSFSLFLRWTAVILKGTNKDYFGSKILPEPHTSAAIWQC